jgi:endonuclease YncB( thermonuclease family)
MNKPLAAFVALVLLGGGAAIIALGGGALKSKVEPVLSEDEAAEALRATQSPANISSHPAVTGAATTSGGEDPSAVTGAVVSEQALALPRPDARAVAPLETPEPTTEETGLERVEPRAALSEIGQALPPRPRMPDEWTGTTLFNPVATAAGTLEAKGYNIAIAGVKPVPPNEHCDGGGKSWPCGVRARAAFRSWLRGRSVICDVPPESDREALVVQCRVGKKDAAEWLIENGWARAASGGTYAALQEAASEAGKGIFGAPPATTAASSSNAATGLPAPAASDNAILSSPLEESQPDAVTSPALSGPLGDFPDVPEPPAAQVPQ